MRYSKAGCQPSSVYLHINSLPYCRAYILPGPLPNSLAVEFFSPFFSPRRDEPPGLLEGILNATIITVVAQVRL